MKIASLRASRMVGFSKRSLLLNICIQAADRSLFSSLTCTCHFPSIQAELEDLRYQITMILSAYRGERLDAAQRFVMLHLRRIFSTSATETAQKVNQDLRRAEAGATQVAGLKVAIV